MKLRYTPRSRPRGNSGGRVGKKFAGFVVTLTFQRVTVDIFRNVFSDVTRSTATVHVLAVKPIFCCAALVSIFFHGALTHNVDHRLAHGWLSEKHHMPVRRRVMVW